jgi:hypothetical protein
MSIALYGSVQIAYFEPYTFLVDEVLSVSQCSSELNFTCNYPANSMAFKPNIY